MKKHDHSSEIETIIRSRRTIHNFKPEKPPFEIIRKGLDAAQWAPNHHLTFPWRFYIPGAETIKSIAWLNAEIVKKKKSETAARAKFERWKSIPGWLVVTSQNGENAVMKQENYAACVCAIHNLSLYLWENGIGLKWSTGDVIRDPRFYNLIWADPEEETVVAIVWYGYPEKIPPMRREPLDRFLVKLP